MTERRPPAEFGVRPHPDDAAACEPWARNVGAPLAVDRAPPAREVRGVDVLCWNVGVGTGRLREVVDRLRGGAWGGAGDDPARPLVVLVQEAFRADPTVPEACTRHHGGALGGPGREDVAEAAEALGMSLRYAPSMRNGPERSDRGNAVLADAALEAAHAFHLPWVRQRRVAVAARLAGVPELALASVHLDVWGRGPGEGRGPWRFGAGRAAQARGIARRLLAAEGAGAMVVAGDLNAPLGAADPAVRALAEEGFVPAERRGDWLATYRGPVPLPLDHVLVRPGGRVAAVEVVRIDEPLRVGGRVFGSDHHPLLARLELAAP